MGSLRPLVKGNSHTRGDPWPALLLVAGFTATATATFGVVWAMGAGLLGSSRATWPVWAIATSVLVGLFVADAGWFGLGTPTWRRQTPKWLMYRFGDRLSAFFWGVDAGLVGTTFRVTSLSWAALALAFIGAIPWWSGLVYAAAFGMSELLLDLAVPHREPRPDGSDPEPVWLTDLLLRIRPWTKFAGLGILGAASVGTATPVVFAFTGV